MSLLDKASLIVTPNSYKESKLYSVVPSDGTGDMTVVRATTATRVNSAGLVEVVPRNLLTYSNTFTNAVWGNAGFGAIAAVIPNNIISPDGLMNGSRITFTTSGIQSRLIQSVPVINGATYRVSIFVKYGNKNTVDLYCDAAVTGLFATFNFTTKAFTAFGVTNLIVTELENGWFRLQYTYIAPSATSQIGFISPNGQDGFIYSYGGQAEIGSSTTEYFPTTTRLNIPRIDYTNGSCPSLLVEPQRTNLLTYSNTFTDASWTKSLATLTPNFGISPDGTQNSTKIVFQANAQLFKLIGTQVNSVSSIYIKGVNGETIQFFNNQTNGYTTRTLNGTWQRFVDIAVGTTYSYVAIGTLGGVTARVVEVWGAQFELGNNATSYIPTVASSVTRNADLISKTGITDLIGQTEGTLFYDIDLKSRVSYNYIAINNGTATNYIGIYITPTNLQLETYVASTLQTAIVFTNSSIGRFKIAAGYKNNDFVLYVNGNLIGTDLIGSVPTCNKLDLTAFNQANSIGFNSVQLYKTKLSNTELQSLTTL